MKVLWITNTIFPKPSQALGFKVPVTGGWMYSLANQFAKISNIELSIATIYSGKTFETLNIEGVVYYLLPSKNRHAVNSELGSYWKTICDEFNPDIVHIHGTEYPHGLCCMRERPLLNYVISIQGLVSIYARHYYAGMTSLNILKNITFRDIVRRRTIFHDKCDFQRRGIFEREYVSRANHIIGRTTWDLVHAKTINPHITYHFCDESLRDPFYSSNKWSIESKINYSIFLSQATYPIKGLHQVLKAVSLLKVDFPSIKVRVAGDSIIKDGDWKDRIRLSGYGSYIRNLISKLRLQNFIEFTGPLSEEQMVSEYKKAHVFICPSSIENSPNSLGEAQIIGVPAIATYVGGNPDMVKHGETGLLYRFEEVEMLSDCIRQVFINNDLAKYLSINEIRVAESRHNRDVNFQQTVSIYNKICDQTFYTAN